MVFANFSTDFYLYKPSTNPLLILYLTSTKTLLIGYSPLQIEHAACHTDLLTCCLVTLICLHHVALSISCHLVNPKLRIHSHRGNTFSAPCRNNVPTVGMSPLLGGSYLPLERGEISCLMTHSVMKRHTVFLLCRRIVEVK